MPGRVPPHRATPSGPMFIRIRIQRSHFLTSLALSSDVLPRLLRKSEMRASSETRGRGDSEVPKLNSSRRALQAGPAFAQNRAKRPQFARICGEVMLRLHRRRAVGTRSCSSREGGGRSLAGIGLTKLGSGRMSVAPARTISCGGAEWPSRELARLGRAGTSNLVPQSRMAPVARLFAQMRSGTDLDELRPNWHGATRRISRWHCRD